MGERNRLPSCLLFLTVKRDSECRLGSWRKREVSVLYSISQGFGRVGNEVSLAPIFSDVEQHGTHSALTLCAGKEGEMKPRMSYVISLNA